MAEGNDVDNADEIKQETVENGIGMDTGVRTKGLHESEVKRIPKHTEKEPGESPWMQNMFTKIYQDLRALSKDFHVPITVPELLFFGFQSSGKTSTLSILAKTPAGTMSDGTGTRCPVRYTLTYNEELRRPRLTVNNIEVANFAEQTKAICDHMHTLATNNGDKFSANILEATIESCDVPNLIFVDMPGLIKKSNVDKYKEWKEQLERITSELGTSRSADGESYAFIPVFVREAYDIENDDGYEIRKIDELFRDKRPYWRDDTLFIINKFDTKGNRRDARSFLRYMKDLCGEGETVITCANPGGERVSAMNAEELAEHIREVPNKEERWWREIIGDFRRKADPDAQLLQEAKEAYCGVKLMDQILVDKMCYIVKNTLPLLQAQLDKREQQYKDYIAKLQKAMELDDPEKLKQRVSEFNHRFLETLKEFYQGRDLAAVRDFRQTWAEDMEQFRSHKYFKTIHQTAQDWDKLNYIRPNELENLLLEMHRQDHVHSARAGLLGGVAVRRALDLWIVMVSLMPFPDYTHEDILNFSDPFSATIQADPWIMIRNVVYHASVSLRKGCIWFGEYLRYRLKTNADIVFEACLSDQFSNTVKSFGSGHGAAYGNNSGFVGGNRNRNRNMVISMNRQAPMGGAQGRNRNRNRNRNWNRNRNTGRGIFGSGGRGGAGKNIHVLNGAVGGADLNANMKKRSKSDQDMQKLLEIGLTDYKKLVDIMVNEFQEAVEVIPADQAEILDRKFHEDIINLSDLLQKLLDSHDLTDPEQTQIDSYVRDNAKVKLADDKQRKKDAKSRNQQQRHFESESIAIQERQTTYAQGKNNFGNKKRENIKREAKKDDNPAEAPKENNKTDLLVDPFAPGASVSNKNDDTSVNTGNIDDSKESANLMPRPSYGNAAQILHRRERFINTPITEQTRDIEFYRTLYPSQPKRQYHHMTDNSTYLIKKLARVVWTCIKKHVITTAQQTLTNRVLAVLKQHGERCHSALLIGIDWPHIQRLVGQLQEKTKIPRAEIEKMIKEQSKIEQQKGVGQMTNEEIRNVYGSNIKEITKEYEAMLLEYKAFLKKKEEIKLKIEALQSMDIVEDID